RTFFAETLAAFCVVLAVWGLTGRPSQRPVGLAGVARAIGANPQTAFFGPVLGLVLAYHQRKIRPLIETCGATLAGSLVYFAYNWYRFEDVTNFGGEVRELSASAFAPWNAIEAIGLLTISPGRG